MKKLKVAIMLLLLALPMVAEKGIASFYHDKYHGRMAANGSIFNQNEMTCAHKTLPFGTVLKVTNLDNNKEVIVTVTDRGPFIEGRVIDLSRAAADSLGYINKGLQLVEFIIVEKKG